jgi:8-amino-7-oxononanoate synthase
MDLFDKFNPIKEAYNALTSGGGDPFGVAFDRIASPTIGVINNREIVLAGTNNYLGLTFDDAVITAGQQALRTFGTGTTGSRIANGTFGPHRLLEEEMAAHYGMSSAIVFTTGYQANLSVVAGLAQKGDQIFIDADCHASIYDACQLSGAEIIRLPITIQPRLTDVWPARTQTVLTNLSSLKAFTACLVMFHRLPNLLR